VVVAGEDFRASSKVCNTIKENSKRGRAQRVSANSPLNSLGQFNRKGKTKMGDRTNDGVEKHCGNP